MVNVNVQQVATVLDTLYPLRYAESWDYPGLIVGDLTDTVRHIVLAADPTVDVIASAIAQHADMVICHHPLLFRSVHEVSGLGVHGHIVEQLYRNHCALWVGHTNADAAYRGVAMAAADMFGLINQRPLVPIDDPNSAHPVGLGRVGHLAQPMPLREFATRIARVLPATQYGVQVAGPLDAPVQSVAVLPGSGDSLFDEVRQSGVDVYVTSDLRHHPATDAIEQAQYEASLRAQGIMIGQGNAQMRPALINTPHSAIESLWFQYALHDIPQAIARATGANVTMYWNKTNTDPWNMTLGANMTMGVTDGR